MHNGQLVTNFLVIYDNSVARQSENIRYLKERFLATDEGKLSQVCQFYYRHLSPDETRINASGWFYLGLTHDGFVKAGDHEMPKPGKRIFAFSHQAQRFYEVFPDGARLVPVTNGLLARPIAV